MKKSRVALVLSGGMSLGAYIADDVDELVRALATDEAYEIDIITGASAGATVAAIMAHGLLYRAGESLLHDVWVDRLDMAELLLADNAATERPALLSDQYLRALAQHFIAWDDSSGAPERAAVAAARLTIAMTFANETSLPYPIPIPGQPRRTRAEPYVQYRNAEQEHFVLDERLTPGDSIWQRIATVARASAASPLIFPLVPLTRRADAPYYFQQPLFAGERRFWYYDGGIYNNLPIDLAWHFAGQDQRAGERVMIIVSPGPTQVVPLGADPPYPGLLDQLLSLQYDIPRASTTRQLAHALTARSRLADARNIPAGPLAAATIPGLGPVPVELLDTFVLVRPEAGTRPLRGSYLGALSGFLDRRFRSYDFRRGAADARRVAEEQLGLRYPAQRPSEFYAPDRDAELSYDISSYEQLDHIASQRDPGRSVQRVFEDALERRIAALIGRGNVPGPDALIAPAAADFLLRQLCRHLATAWAQPFAHAAFRSTGA